MAPLNIFRSLQSIRSNINEDEFRVLDPSSGPSPEFRTQTRVQDPDASSGPRHEFRTQTRVQVPVPSSGARYEFRTQTRVQVPDTSSGPRHEFRSQTRVQVPVPSSGPRHEFRTQTIVRLFILFGSESGVGVGDSDVELLGAFDDQLALLRGDGVGDLGRVDAVLHQKHLQVGNVVHQEFLEAIRTDVLGFGVTSVTDVGHFVLTLESSADSVVDTLGFSPVGLDAEEVDGLMTDELFRPLLHDLLVIQRAHHLHF